MFTEVITPPEIEPITIDEAKAHLRVDLDDEDALIEAAVTAARTYAENFMRRKLITQTLKTTANGFGGSSMALPLGPVQSVTQVQYKQTTDGALTTWAADQYQLVKSVIPQRLAPAYGVTWPVTRADYDNVEITYSVGYGDDAADVPGDIIAAIKLLLGHFYENREDEVAGTVVSKVTLSARRLLMPYVVAV